MLFIDAKHVKTKIVKNPMPIKLDQLNLGNPGEDDSNNYEMAMNLSAPGVENMAYHYRNNKMDKLQEHEKRIDQLHLENYKLKKEKKRLEELLKSRTEEMLSKFFTSDNQKIQLAERIEEDKHILDLNSIIHDSKKNLEEAIRIKSVNDHKIKELGEEIKSFNSELVKLASNSDTKGKLFH
jgi:vacuolar-type H+-ATPase subunit I/STV1